MDGANPAPLVEGRPWKLRYASGNSCLDGPEQECCVAAACRGSVLGYRKRTGEEEAFLRSPWWSIAVQWEEQSTDRRLVGVCLGFLGVMM